MAANSNQRNFFLAVTLSLGILLLWSFLFPPPKQNPNTNANTQQQQAATQNATPAPDAPAQQTQIQNQAPDTTPNRIVTVKTDLYEAKFDSRGALISSLILKKSVSSQGEKELHSANSTKQNQHPLELISQESVNRREIPLKILTGDAGLDTLLNDRNYQISGANEDTINLSGDKSQKIEFVLRDEANQLESVKTLTFYGNSYVSDLQTKITRNGQPVSNAKLLIGSNIGDQGIQHYDFYHIEPEAVAVVNGSPVRHKGNEIVVKQDKKIAAPGTVNWGGVGDTYFAMAAIPAQPAGAVEFQSAAYDVELAEPRTNGIWGFLTGDKITKETRHLTSTLIPIQTDGASVTKIYTGTKDHFVLAETADKLSSELGRPIDLGNFIYYSWLGGTLVRPIAVPILWVLNKINLVTHNIGLAILIFTLAFFSLLFPMRWYQSKSFKKAAKNAPKMKELQERMKDLQAKKVPLDDPRMRELQMEQLKLTKDAVPIGGCLPMLLQMPLIFALYTAILISLDFRQAGFLWLPDLSAGDPFHILEFIFAGSMALSMVFTPTAPAVTPEQQMQQRMMTYMMPLMMLWVMWGSPAGLLVYWVASNIIGFVQQIVINRLTKTPDEPANGSKATNEKALTKKELKTKFSTT